MNFLFGSNKRYISLLCVHDYLAYRCTVKIFLDLDTKSNNAKNILHILCRLYNIMQDVCIVEAEWMLHKCGLQHILMKVNYWLSTFSWTTGSQEDIFIRAAAHPQPPSRFDSITFHFRDRFLKVSLCTVKWGRGPSERQLLWSIKPTVSLFLAKIICLSRSHHCPPSSINLNLLFQTLTGSFTDFLFL